MAKGIIPPAQMQFVLTNRSDQPVTLDYRQGANQPQGAAPVVLAPHSKALLSKEALDRLSLEDKQVEAELNYTLTNKTARRIGLERLRTAPPAEAGEDDDEPGGLFVIPPLGQRTVPQKVFNRLSVEPWEQRNLIGVAPIRDAPEENDESSYLALGCLV